jgi:kanamycin kinase
VTDWPRSAAAGLRNWRRTEAWRGDAVTWRLEHPDGRARYLKVAPEGTFPSLQAEADRMRWASAYLPVPEVLELGREGGVEWLLTSALPGRSAVDDELQRDPASLVRALARGLRRFHTAPVASCPFDFRLEPAMTLVAERVRAGLVEPGRDLHPEHAGLTPEEALARLQRTPPRGEDLVVCHGDYCLPNAILGEGEVTGYVDLGELGVADRWWDLAVAAWSVTWNLGPGWEELFLSSYGVDPDPGRIAFYRLLYDLAS